MWPGVDDLAPGGARPFSDGFDGSGGVVPLGMSRHSFQDWSRNPTCSSRSPIFGFMFRVTARGARYRIKVLCPGLSGTDSAATAHVLIFLFGSLKSNLKIS